MPFNRDPPPPEEIAKWFLQAPDAPPGTFELALVLGGTVSAGAYTAGAIDFLIEALDCFCASHDSPKHKVVLKLIAGTSGGGVNTAIAARALGYRFPAMSRATPIESLQTGNPFYDVWVNTLRLPAFLKTSDLTDKLVSVLNGEPIDIGAEHIVEFGSGTAQARPWVAAPLRIILTVTNLRGVPYKIDLGNGLRQTYVDHADYIRYGVLYPDQTPDPFRPDELILPVGAASAPALVAQMATWSDFSVAARATAAFPLGFPPRTITRPTEHYRYRVVPYPGLSGAPESYLIRVPDWDSMCEDGGDVPAEWQFLAVDGGATDNEPIELARTALAGLLGRNPRDPKLANRAVWLIDPFAGQAELGPQSGTTFVDQLGSVTTTLTQQTRYDTADLFMAANPNICSRFMLTPTRRNRNGDMLTGSEAIASGGLWAFIGFACPEFMRFDYLLGRMNCQSFLREEFVLDQENPLFDSWTPAQRTKFAPKSDTNALPIIPLVGSAANLQEIDDWPKGKLDPESYRHALEARFSAILHLEISGDPGKFLVSHLGAWLTKGEAAEYIIKAMNAYLATADLA